MSDDNKWEQPAAPPPPLFTGKKERDLVKQVNDELIERVIGQTVLYYPIDVDKSDFHSLYGEAIEKSFLPPVRVHALIDYQETDVNNDGFGYDKMHQIEIFFHRRRLTEDQNLFVRVGDFVQYDRKLYEIVKTSMPKYLFGQDDQKFLNISSFKPNNSTSQKSLKKMNDFN